ncbi:ABC transporter ATP-binding protein [Oscillospiraceae bacterium HV4-5-C5C]|nr:ABC transporter ATP-binding protein [Oscillospiraceae bacterium HV4-5-C5C]
MPDTPVLELEHVTVQFGGVVAVDSLDLTIQPGEIVALIGPNGAGKTTAFNAITGVYKPTNGCIRFKGDILEEDFPQGKMRKLYRGRDAGQYQKRVVRTPDEICRLGIARTFQNIRLFKQLTVFENVLIAYHCHIQANIFASTFRLNHREERRMRDGAMALLDLVGLADSAQEKADNLPYGKQRHLEIARALATQPELLLLDEPAAGMNPQETDELTSFIYDMKERFKLTIFMIEHHMNLVMDISDRIYVVDFGKRIADGRPEEIQSNPAVISAYLGVQA